MTSLLATRHTVLTLALAGAGSLCAFATQPPPQRHAPAPPPPRQGPPPASNEPRSSILGIQRRENPGQKPNGEHLATWLDHHSNLTPDQQKQALQKEPGFANLPPQTQQRFKDRLTQLDSMSPDQRNRIISRTEAMERLTPEQRGQVRSAMMPLAMLPQDRRKVVAHAFRQYRDLPPQQRAGYINSPDVRSQLNDNERNVLSGLIAVEPYVPPAQ